jgi:hypothetical protein
MRAGSIVRAITFQPPEGLYVNNPEFEAHDQTFKSLGFSDVDLSYMHGVFRSIDKDLSGEISLIEMLEHLDVPRTAFAKRVFSIFE